MYNNNNVMKIMKIIICNNNENEWNENDNE